MESLEKLNEEFGLSGHIEFKEGPGGLIFAAISNDSASARVFLHGAHLTSFIPKGREDLIYISPNSRFERGTAIRGGIPISWPWFADHPTDKTKPAHGFARTSLWHVRKTKKLSDSETEIRFGLTKSNSTMKLFGYDFYLEAVFTISTRLNIALRTINLDTKDFSVSSAFHSYYKVSDISEISINGLEDAVYVDKVDAYTTKRQEGSVTIGSETDRIYVNTANECVIQDPGLKRAIRISKSGSQSTVVWNPWEKTSQEMKDLGGGEYRNFVCVETTNAGVDTITIPRGDEHILRMNARAESL